MDTIADTIDRGRRSASPVIDFVGEEEGAGATADHSLIADLDALFSDGKTYLEAELAFQKSRVAFSGSRIKWAFIYGAAAFGFLHLALIAFVVGVVIALTPVLGPWLSIMTVVGLLLVGAFVFIQRLRRRLREVRAVFEQGEP